MVRLRRLLDHGSEVTFAPGDGEDDGRVYEVRVTALEGGARAASGPTPQAALLAVSRMEAGGRQVTYAQAAGGGWFADLREEDGTITATGRGRSHAEALASLREQADDDGEDGLEPYCAGCGAQLGIFIGRGPGWHHFRGSGTVQRPVELFDADHAPALAWRERAALDAR